MAKKKTKLKKLPQRKWKARPEVLLCPNIPKPMHGTAPRVVLGGPWWNKVRKEAYASTNEHCVACGIHKLVARGPTWLEGHELYKIDYALGRMYYLETVPLCHYCHNFIHDGRMMSLMHQGKFPQYKYTQIVQHGNRVLKANGLERLSYADREEVLSVQLLLNQIAPWKTWKLVIDGKEYAQKFKSEVQWRKAMQ